MSSSSFQHGRQNRNTHVLASQTIHTITITITITNTSINDREKKNFFSITITTYLCNYLTMSLYRRGMLKLMLFFYHQCTQSSIKLRTLFFLEMAHAEIVSQNGFKFTNRLKLRSSSLLWNLFHFSFPFSLLLLLCFPLFLLSFFPTNYTARTNSNFFRNYFFLDLLFRWW